MRRASIHALFALAVLFFTSCSDRGPAEPEEQLSDPIFSTLMSQCWPDDVVGQINALFPPGLTRTAALQRYGVILGYVQSGRTGKALSKAKGFERFVRARNPDTLSDPCGSAAPTIDQAKTVLIGNVYAVAGGGSPIVIPPEAYEPTGGIGLIDPVTGGVVRTTNQEAAVVADEDAFDGTGLVTIVLVRLLDPDVGQPPGSGPIPGYQAYPEGYDITSTRQLTPEGNGGTGAIVELCVVTDGLDPTIDSRLVIGHDAGGGQAELLYPRLGPSEVSCGNAGPYPAPIVSATDAPTWLNLAHRAIQPALGLLGPKPLRASFVAGRGLGGRTKSFSNFSPVDPWSLSVSPKSATIDLGSAVTELQLAPTLTVPPDETDPPNPFPANADYGWTSSDESVAVVSSTGLVSAESEGTVTITASYQGLSANSEITVESSTFTLMVIVYGDGQVYDDTESIDCPENCSAEFDAGETVYLFGVEGMYSILADIVGDCEDVGGDPDCTIVMDEDQTVEFYFEEGPL